jgi:hypothetical protein
VQAEDTFILIGAGGRHGVRPLPEEAATNRCLKMLLLIGAGGRHGVRSLCSARQQDGAAARAHGGAIGTRRPGGILANLVYEVLSY